MTINKPIIKITIKNARKHNVDAGYLVVASLLVWSYVEVQLKLRSGY